MKEIIIQEIAKYIKENKDSTDMRTRMAFVPMSNNYIVFNHSPKFIKELECFVICLLSDSIEGKEANNMFTDLVLKHSIDPWSENK